MLSPWLQGSTGNDVIHQPQEGVIPAWAVDTQTLGWLDGPNKALVSPVGLRVEFPSQGAPPRQGTGSVSRRGGAIENSVYPGKGAKRLPVCVEANGAAEEVRLCPCPCRAGLSSQWGGWEVRGRGVSVQPEEERVRCRGWRLRGCAGRGS